MRTKTTKAEKPEGSGGDSEVTTNETMLKDGGWGWFVSHVLTGGFDRSGGVFYLKFLERFGGSAAETAWVLALFSSFWVLFGPLSSALTNRFSCRTVVFCGAVLSMAGVLVSGYAVSLIPLYFSYGVITGFGMSMAFTPGLVIVSRYFTKRRGIVVGLVSVGNGVGSFLFPPFTQLLFETFGFPGTFLLLSGIMSQLFVVGALYRSVALHRRLEANKRYEKNPLAGDGPVVIEEPLLETQDEEHRLPGSLPKSWNTNDLGPAEGVSSTVTGSQAKEPEQRIEQKTISPNKKPDRILNFALLKDVVFVCVCLQSYFYQLLVNIMVTFLPALVKDQGLTLFQGSVLISIIGISDAVSRIIAAVVLDTKPFKRHRMHIYNSLAFIAMIVSVLLPFMTRFWHFSILCAIYGFVTGIHISQSPIIIIEVVGIKNLSSGLGFFMGVNGVSAILAPTIGSLLRDYLGSYSPAFYFGSAGIFLSGCTMSLGNWFFHRRVRRPKK